MESIEGDRRVRGLRPSVCTERANSVRASLVRISRMPAGDFAPRRAGVSPDAGPLGVSGARRRGLCRHLRLWSTQLRVRTRVLGRGGLALAHRLAAEGEAIAVVHEPIEDGVGDGTIAEVGVPLIDGQLAGDQR